tara:strand:+ start:18465 stop:20942 length:2478 start_codon:yes stop_codon:yes gene_type:complete
VATQTIEIRAVDKTQAALKNIQRNTQNLERGFGKVATAAKGFIAVLAIGKIIEAGTAIKNIVAEYENLNNKLKLVTGSTEEFRKTELLLKKAATDNRTGYADTVDLYTKLTLATESMGVSQAEVIGVTGKLSKALQVSGADASTTSSVIRQFGQAMASGTVRGDEFNSLVEGLGPALAIMARETGLSVGALRRMSQNGELTAEALFKMLQNSEQLEGAFQSMDQTIDQLEQSLSDAFKESLVQLTEASGAADLYRDSLTGLTRALDYLSGAEGALVNMETDKILEGLADGTINVANAFVELEERYSTLFDLNQGFVDGSILATGAFKGLALASDMTAQELSDMIVMVTALKEEQEKLAEETKAFTEEQNKLRKAIASATKPFKSAIDLAEKYANSGFGSALDKNEQKIKAVNKALKMLVTANETVMEVNGKKVVSDERLVELTGVLTLELKALTEQNTKLKDAQNDLTESGNTYGEFLTDTIKAMNESIKMDEFKRMAIADISAKYEDGVYSLKQYEAAMQALDSTFVNTAGSQKKAAEDLLKIQDALKNDVQALSEAYETHFMDRAQLATHAHSVEIAKLQEAYSKQAIDMQMFNDLKVQSELVLQDKLGEIREKAAQDEKKRQESLFNSNLASFKSGKFGEVDVTEMTEESKKKFAVASARSALQEVSKHNKAAFQANKALNIAEAVMNTYTGATKALASYPPPFNFIAAAAVVAAGFANVASIRSQSYQGRQRGGALTVGQSTVVGEDGPELIVPKQASTVIPREVAQAVEGLGGGGGEVTVNFNINTVDARGFDDLLIERRGTITGIINQAMQSKGRRGVV